MTETGFITPKGDFIFAPTWGHEEKVVEYLKEQGQGDVVKRAYEEGNEAVDEQLESYAQWAHTQIQMGDHPEWHNYDMIEDDRDVTCWRFLMREVYKMGFIRFAPSKYGNRLYFEGYAPFNPIAEREARKYARDLGIKPKFKDVS